MPHAWQVNLGYAWNKLRSEGGYTWAAWRTVKTADGYIVQDGNGKTVIETSLQPLADMVAGLPELMEPDLRSTVLYVQTANGQSRQISAAASIGIDDAQEAYDRGYTDGWQHGSDDMERTLCEAEEAEEVDTDEDTLDQPYSGGDDE
jgi:hypothetical protein